MNEDEATKAKFTTEIVEPVDFTLSAKQLSSLSCPTIATDFEFVLDDKLYRCNKELARSVFTNVNAELNRNPELSRLDVGLDDPNFYFQLVQSLLAGETIAINEQNAYFLNSVAVRLGNDPLKQATERFMLRYEHGTLKEAKWYSVIGNLILCFFCNIAIVTKLILFLCELIGFAIGFAFVFNLFMVPLTSGLISPTIRDGFRWGLMLPFMIFNVNTVTLLEILVFYICKANHFIAKSALPKHTQLVKMIFRVWPWCRKRRDIDFREMELLSQSASNTSVAAETGRVCPKNSYFVGDHSMYNFSLGFLLIFMLGCCLYRNVFKYIVIALATVIPTVLLATVMILYGVHAFLSSFSGARERFVEYGDFSDPFICSMYFHENPWLKFFRKFGQWIRKRRAQRKGLAAPLDDTDVANEPMWKVTITAIFSKFTASLYIVVGLFLLLVSEWRLFDVDQAFLVVFVIICIVIPVMATVNFCFLFIERFWYPSFSESQVKSTDKWMHSERQRIQWLYAWFTWGKEAKSLRICRMLWIGFYFLAAIGAIWPTVVFKTAPEVTTRDVMERILTHEQYLALQAKDRNISLYNPICRVNVSGLDMTQMSAFAEAAYIENLTTDSQELDNLLSTFFDKDWKNYIEVIPDVQEVDWTHGQIGHFRYTKDGQNLHIVSIRGTTNTIDVMADVELWASSFIMNVLKATIPIFHGYADDSRLFLGYAMHLPRYMFNHLSLINGYISLIYDFVSQMKVENGMEIVLTGHSLGGGLAKLISSMTGYQAISYSGPGITALAAFYQWEDEHIIDSFVNIVPQLDPVPMVDQSTGSDFLIPCQSGMIACHNILRTMCMLATLCGTYTEHYDWCYANLGSSEAEMQHLWDLGHPFYYFSPGGNATAFLNGL